MSSSRWVITPLWLSRSLRFFFFWYSSVYSCYLFLICSASVRSLLFLSLIMPILSWNIPLIFPIFEEISSLSHSIVFLYFLHYSFKKTFLSLLAILWNSVFSWVYLFLTCLLLPSLLSSAICKATSDNHFAFSYFFSGGWFCSLPCVQYHEPLSIVLQAFCLIPWLYLSPLMYNHMGFDLGHTWMV